MFTRKVEVADIARGGVSLRVLFNIMPSKWPSLHTPYQSAGGGADQGEFLVYSPRFMLVSEAAKWLVELTEEVKTLCVLDREITDLFRKLEGEEIIQ